MDGLLRVFACLHASGLRGHGRKIGRRAIHRLVGLRSRADHVAVCCGDRLALLIVLVLLLL